MEYYNKISKLISYPEKDLENISNELLNYFQKTNKKVYLLLKNFHNFLLKTSLNEQEEVYTQSFEVQSITTLDIGYVLFGDDYKRAELLVNLSKEHNKVNNDCGKELADHLPNVINLLPKIKDKTLQKELVQNFVAPALKKIINEFSKEKMDKKSKIYKKHHKTLIKKSGTYWGIYKFPLQALYILLFNDFNISEINEKNHNSKDFLRSIDTEMKIEKN